MVISNHSPFVKVWFIIQLIAKHLNWWMRIGYVKFNMLHRKISHWILGDSFWFSNKIRSFSGSMWGVLGRQWRNLDASSYCALFVRRMTPKLKSTCILTWPVQRTESCLIIPQLPRFWSVQTQWAVEINMSTGSAKLVGCAWANGFLIYTYIIFF